jgi:hypothetical protein
LGNTAAATAAFTIVPSNVVSGLGHKAPSDKLNIAGIGVRGMGHTNINNMQNREHRSLCDVDGNMLPAASRIFQMQRKIL